jgi:AAA+ ATPase superfamily predicted ATPase
MLSIDVVKDLKTLEHWFQNADWEDNVPWNRNEPLALCGVTGSGKTAAVMKFCAAQSNRLYFSFRNLTADIAPKIFSAQHPEVFSSCCNDWDSFFASLRNYFAGKYHVLAFDDLDDRNDREVFLRALSNYMAEDEHRNPFVILPLRKEESVPITCYHRHLRTYMPADLRRSFPKMTDEDRMRLYSITGGRTGLLSLYDEGLPFDENLKEFCRRDSRFARFGSDILHEQFRSPESYSGILSAIAAGNQRLSDIAAFAGYSNKKCGIYLQALCDAGFVSTKKKRSADRRSTTRYYFNSGYSALWARFLMTQQVGSIADDMVLWTQIRDYIDHTLVPDHFRRLCMRWFFNRRGKYELDGHSFTEEFHERNNYDFDHIYGSGKKKCLLKIWTDLDGRYGAKEYQALEDNSVRINLFYHNDYFFFSIHRFKDDLWAISKQYDNVHLVEARFLT